MTLNRLKAMQLLAQCTGVDIWSLETCRAAGVPSEWIDELCDCFESGFQDQRDTIYFEERVVNQFEGVHDLRLARKLASMLGVNVEQVTAMCVTRESEVRALQEAVEEL